MDLSERLITILLFLTYGNAQLDSIISFTPAERVALKPVSWEENSECTWKRNGREIAADPNKYEFANRKNELVRETYKLYSDFISLYFPPPVTASSKLLRVRQPVAKLEIIGTVYVLSE
ncbi:hypothetical protein D915_000402 [Fasciola hepatica]|uniref:Uncharacterized protein n=1 Tax=Fasciola hepatica TaxID=6192 RepID=A0A4E0RP41_FASHE|nr:hypothetical protein D915_000402 [Fasciola hepatica]